MSTIAEIARIAGVSVSTVSHVLNKTRFVSPEKVQRVNEVVAAVDYTPNSLARSLKMATTRTVGLVISAISNPYFSDIICSVEAECSRRGFTVFLCDSEDTSEKELAIVRQLHQRRVDGIILAPSPQPTLSLSYLLEKHLPCVLVDRMADPRFDQVGVDNVAAVTELVEHVTSFGHRRIGFIGGQPGFTTTVQRIEAFKAAMMSRGLVVPAEYLSVGNGGTTEAAESAHRLFALATPPTAIIAGNNLAMIGVMRAVCERGLRIPADLSVLGIDDFEWADYFQPRLTLMAQPCGDLGRRASDLLVERIGNPAGPRHTVQLSPALHVRDSCGAPK
jgi:LacI family transcriptional regulator